MNAAIKAAAKRVANLDATPFNERIDKSRSEIVKLEAAIDKAFERQAQIQALLRDVQEQHLLRSKAGHAIAEKLLAGDLEAAVRPDTQLLDDELDLLKSGVRELRNRIDVERQNITTQQVALRREVGKAFDGLAEQFEVAAKQASAQLIDVYAASFILEAVGQRSDIGALKRKLARAMPGLATHGDNIDQRVGGFDVPAWVRPVLDAVADFDASTAQSVPRIVQMPI